MGLPDKRPSRMLPIDEGLGERIEKATLQSKFQGRHAFSLAIGAMTLGLLFGETTRRDIEQYNKQNARFHEYATYACRKNAPTQSNPAIPVDALALNFAALCAGRPERKSYLPLFLLGIPFIVGTGVVAYRAQYRMSNPEIFGQQEACIADILERTACPALYTSEPISERSAYEPEKPSWEQRIDESEQ